MLLDFKNLKEKYNLQIDGVIHIGAHYGEENKIYESNKIKNVIYFEPLPNNFFMLEQMVSNSNYDLINIALGNENKKIKMYVETANNGQSSSILKPKLHLQQYPHITFDAEREVSMIKLDDFMTPYKANSKNKNKKFNFINIDVQGYELEVFKGSTETLKNIDYIISEVNRDFVYEGCVLIEELDSYLKEFNFQRVETTWDGETWGDALYIKK